MSANLVLGGPWDGEWVDSVSRHLRVDIPRPTPIIDPATRDTTPDVGLYTLRRLSLFGRTIDLWVWDADTDDQTNQAIWRHLMSQTAIQAHLGTAFATKRLR